MQGKRLYMAYIHQTKKAQRKKVNENFDGLYDFYHLFHVSERQPLNGDDNMTTITTAITLADTIALFLGVKNERVTITSKRAITLLGGKKNPMQGKVFKESTYAVYIGSMHQYGNKLNKEGDKIATHESIEQDKELEHMEREIQALWKGMGQHDGGGIVSHKESGKKYLYFYPDPKSIPKVEYTYEGKPIKPEDVDGFNEKIREGASIALTDGSEHETKVFPTALGIENLRNFRIGGVDYMVTENIEI